MTSEISMLKPLGYQRRNSCGYCHNKTGSSSYYLQCSNMRLEHYQELVDRGWRRSGILYYKPDLLRSCCPHYAIRLRASEFNVKKEQRQAINRLNNYILGPEYKRKAAMLCPQSREEKRRKRDIFDLQDTIRRAQYVNVKRPKGKKSDQPIEPAHKFEINLEAATSTKEKYEMFLRYQTHIHKDPVSRWPESAFKRFLCGGLDRKVIKSNGKTQKLGTYHQCYRMDGKLVAVGVLDLLSHAVSSVYLFYDPDFGHWDFGKISALNEINMTLDGRYEYYYMGYYIHSCTKMRYKGTFSPSYLLDPETFQWNLLDDAYREKLDHRKYYSPSHEEKGLPWFVDDEEKPKAGSEEMELELQGNKSGSPDTSTSKLNNDESLEFDEDDSEDDDADIPEGSLFEYNIPGVLTKDEVLKLDLDHWKLLVRKSLIELEDLRGWEEWKIDDPGSIKGIAAELIAATGPNLLQNSAIALF